MLFEIDSAIFQFVNTGLSNPVFDFLMPWFREKLFWIPLYIGVAFLIVKHFQKKAIWIILCIALSSILSDTISSKIVKPTFKRLRPCNEPALENKIQERVNCGSGFSFTSSHATNHAALGLSIAFFLSIIYPNRKKAIYITAFTWAFLISFAQVYVGVHYPFDVLCGLILGTVVFLCLKMFVFEKFIYHRWL
jgi:membrane-associated phospholipid phosphatase